MTRATSCNQPERAPRTSFYVNALMLGAVIERSRTMLEPRNAITLSNDAYDRFYATLDSPPEAVPELIQLFRLSPFPRG